jgi:hypothetical protein
MAISHLSRPIPLHEYVSEFNVQDFVKVGTTLQYQYGEGVKKIQQSIDEIAGLPMLRDIDKQYLSAKVAGLTSELNKYSNVDFSNVQNVNAVLQVAKPVYNDQNIVNAVASTQEYSRRIKTLQEIKEKKPDFWSPQNEAFFLSDVNEWLEGGVDKRLRPKEFQPYRDVNDKLIKLAEKIKPNVITEIQQSKDGKYLTKTEIESLTAERVKQQVMGMLDSADLGQLQIDAWYKYKDAPPEVAKQEAWNKDRGEAEDLYKQSKDYLNRATESYNAAQRLAKSNPAYAKMLPEIEANYKRAQFMHQEYLSRFNQYNSLSNYDNYDFKASLTNRYINEMTSGIGEFFEYSQVKKDMKENPYAILATKHAYDLDLERVKGENDIKKEAAKRGFSGDLGTDLNLTLSNIGEALLSNKSSSGNPFNDMVTGAGSTQVPSIVSNIDWNKGKHKKGSNVFTPDGGQLYESTESEIRPITTTIANGKFTIKFSDNSVEVLTVKELAERAINSVYKGKANLDAKRAIYKGADLLERLVEGGIGTYKIKQPNGTYVSAQVANNEDLMELFNAGLQLPDGSIVKE